MKKEMEKHKKERRFFNYTGEKIPVGNRGRSRESGGENQRKAERAKGLSLTQTPEMLRKKGTKVDEKRENTQQS